MGLPEPIVAAVANDPYDKGDCDFSATELIAPAYQRRLMRENKDMLTVDASSRIWSLMGQSVHGILERASGDGYILERRYVAEVRPYPDKKVRVGAKIDVYHPARGILDDYKVTSVYKFQRDLAGDLKVPPEWEAQLNIQAYCIYAETGMRVSSLRIIGILRDWRRSEAMKEKGYPQTQVMPMLITTWDPEKTREYILRRVREHMDPNPPPCSSEEMWERPTRWALMREGQKRAVRVFSNGSAAEAHRRAYQDQGDGNFYVEERPGSRTRCEGYCDAAEFCPAFRRFKGLEVEEDIELPF